MQDAPDINVIISRQEKHQIGKPFQFAAAQSRQIELVTPARRSAFRIFGNLRVGGLQRINEAEGNIGAAFGKIMVDCLLGILPRQFARYNGQRFHEAAC